MLRKIVFKGENFILVGDTDGAIAKEDEYKQGRPSFAHLYPNGEVNRHGNIIGDKSDIEFGNPVEIELTDDAWDGLFNDSGWRPPPPFLWIT